MDLKAKPAEFGDNEQGGENDGEPADQSELRGPDFNGNGLQAVVVASVA